jgi:lysophospholipase L1-like esterase
VTDDPLVHRSELERLAIFGALCFALAGAAYLPIPHAEALRPWLSGEPVPLIHLLFPEHREVQEDETGELVVLDAPPLVEVPTPAPETPQSRLPRRDGAIATIIELEEGTLDPFFEKLALAEGGEPGRIVRVLHWGDSTIAADGICRTVRSRLQARFGDGGPGFLPVHVDTRWQIRPGILRHNDDSEWETFNVTVAGSDEWRYGIGGHVSTATGEASVTMGGTKGSDGTRQKLYRFDVYYQAQPGGGSVSIVPRGTGGAKIHTAADRVQDRFREIKSPGGSDRLWIKTHGDGPVSLYGIALETLGPGVTWETLGVAGSSIASMINHQGRVHLKGQVAHRNPDLIVYQTGGNELDYPDLRRGDGSAYRGKYLVALGKIRAGAPEVPCLMIGPIDQGTRVRGKVVSRDGLNKIIRLQREAAVEAGCAYWNARGVMGGDGGFARWIQHDPKLASTDLLHLSSDGFDLVGESLADALLDRYDQWRLQNPRFGFVPEDAEDAWTEPPPSDGGLELDLQDGLEGGVPEVHLEGDAPH